jgi:anti-sigma factor RsiW
MSDYNDDADRCVEWRDDLAELALGVLSGRRRSEVLNHVESCARCSAELEQLSIVADNLLQLAPEVEPPLGFELRLAERLHVTAAVQGPQRLRRNAAIGVAALVIAVLGFGLGAAATRPATTPTAATVPGLTSAPLVAKGKALGEVLVSSGSPAWLLMTIDGGNTWSRVTCEVTLASGKVERVGAFRLSHGYGAWSAPLTAMAGEVRSARLLGANGTVLARATISA